MGAAPVPGAAGVIRLRRPLHLASLLREGLVLRQGEAILVPARIPLLDDAQQRRLHPSLRAEYRRGLGLSPATRSGSRAGRAQPASPSPGLSGAASPG